MSASKQQQEAAARRLALVVKLKSEGMAPSLIAQRLGVKAATVSWMLSKARRDQLEIDTMRC